MRPLAVIGLGVAYNYWEHLHGRQTACSFTRQWVPPVVFVAGWIGLTEWLVPHYIDGFRIDLTSLTD